MSRLLAFVDIFVESPYMDEVVQALQKLPNMEELYEVTGEFDIVSLVSAADIEEFRDILKNRIMRSRELRVPLLQLCCIRTRANVSRPMEMSRNR